MKSISSSLAILLFLVLLLPTLGCQSERADWQTVCDAPNQVDNPEASNAQRQVAVTMYIAQNLSHDEVIAFFEDMETMTPEERDRAIDEIPTRSGIDDCPFVAFHNEIKPSAAQQTD